MGRSVKIALRKGLLVALFVATVLVIVDGDPGPVLEVAPSGAANEVTAPSPTTRPGEPTPGATPRGKEIYKGYTLEEIRADPSLLAEVNALSDYLRPIHGEPEQVGDP